MAGTRCSSPSGFGSRKHSPSSNVYVGSSRKRSPSGSGYLSSSDAAPCNFDTPLFSRVMSHTEGSTYVSAHNSRRCSPNSAAHNSVNGGDISEVQKSQNNSRKQSPSQQSSRTHCPNIAGSFTFTPGSSTGEFSNTCNGVTYDIHTPAFSQSVRPQNNAPNKTHGYTRSGDHSKTYTASSGKKQTSNSTGKSSQFSKTSKKYTDYNTGYKVDSRESTRCHSADRSYAREADRMESSWSTRCPSPDEYKATPYKVDTPGSTNLSRKGSSSASNFEGCKLNNNASTDVSCSSFELSRKPSPLSANPAASERFSLTDLGTSSHYPNRDSAYSASAPYTSDHKGSNTKGPCPLHGKTKSSKEFGRDRLSSNGQSKSYHAGHHQSYNTQADLDLQQLKEATLNAKRHSTAAEPSLYTSYHTSKTKQHKDEDIDTKVPEFSSTSNYKDYFNRNEYTKTPSQSGEKSSEYPSWQKSVYSSLFADVNADIKNDPIFQSYLESSKSKLQRGEGASTTPPDPLSDLSYVSLSSPGSVTPTCIKTRSQIENSNIDKEYHKRSAEFKESLLNLSSKSDLSIKLKPTTRLIGEICFQLDRKILNFVFRLNAENKKRRRFYGYIIQNIVEKINRECTDKNNEFVDDNKKHMLQCRYLYVLKILKPLGYNVTFHPDFCADMVSKLLVEGYGVVTFVNLPLQKICN